MRRSELKEMLENQQEKCWYYYRQHPNLHRDLALWEDYLTIERANRHKGIHPPKERARMAILEKWMVGENTFYKIHRLLRERCEDVE